MAIGLSIAEYNEITPYELRLSIEAYSERMKMQHEDSITAAYLTALWGRVKKMPNLNKILGRKPKKQQTPEQMLAMVKAMHAAMKGETKKTKSE